MTSDYPDVARIVVDQEGDSIVTRRREDRLEEIAAVTVVQVSTITHTDPVVENPTTVSTRDSSVEQNKTTNGYRSGKREVDREWNRSHGDPVARNYNGT